MRGWMALVFLLLQHATGHHHKCHGDAREKEMASTDHDHECHGDAREKEMTSADHDESHRETKRQNILACENNSVSLGCDSGFIKVIDANYGRTNEQNCSDGKTLSQISTTNCSQPTSLKIMSTRCNGRKNCSVPAANSVFTDPCFGTYKYLNVTYECRPWRQSITCEDEKSSIDCGRRHIVIHHANFGRRTLFLCPHKRATSADCYSDQTDDLRYRCDGKHVCRLHASKSIYGEPCLGVYKYLAVTYTCERAPEE